MLYKAIQAGNKAIFQKLFQKSGISGHHKIYSGRTVFCSALIHQQKEIYTYLLRGGQVTLAEHGVAALFHAMMTDKAELLQELIEIGVPVTCDLRNNETALNFALYYASTNAFLILIKKAPILAQMQNYDKQLPLHIAVIKTELTKVKALLSVYPEGALIKNELGQTPYSLALETMDDAMISLFEPYVEAHDMKPKLKRVAPIIPSSKETYI
ncbi:ankyrin repeat domain-containing protein [Parashewanella curva]|nr:ankyrin repeat domain-containing protein [Parashewanella curva]